MCKPKKLYRMKNLLIILSILFLVQTRGHCQLANRLDTLKYFGQETTKQKKTTVKNHKIVKVLEISHCKSFIKLNPDSTYEKKDFYGDIKSTPLITTGFWIWDKNRIYFYSTRKVVGTDWTHIFKIDQDNLKYLF